MNNHIIKTRAIIPEKTWVIIQGLAPGMNVESFTEFLAEKLNIDSIHDPDIVAGYEKDSSNLPGNAKGLCRPNNEVECAIILAASH